MADGTSHSGAVHTNNSQSSKYSASCRAGAGGKAIAMRTISRPKIIGAISPPPYAQSSPPKPDAEASQSPPAAHRDDSLATNPSAGLVTEDHPSKRRRGGWGLAGVFAVVAWLAWLACPTAAFALTNTISISSVAGDNVVTASEKWNGFKITGHTGNQSNIPVVVTFGTETWNTTSTTLIDGNYWWSVSVPGKSSYITDGDNQTVNAEATFSGGIKLSHSRTFNVDLTLPLVVDAVTGDDVINDGVIHITGDTGDIGSVRIDLVIGTGSFINASDLAGEWLQTVLAADNQSYITGSSASLSVTATKTGYEPSATVSRTLTKDLVHPPVVAGTLTLNVDDVTDDNTINQSEHTNNFAVTGNTGTDSGVTVTVTIGGTALTSVTSAIAVGATEATWSVTVPANADYITETSVELSVTATKPNYTDAPSVSRTLTVDLTAPTVSYMEPSNLQVGKAIMAMVPTKSEDIFSYAISGGSLPRGLSLNGTTGVISGVPTTGTPNMQTVGVLATDGAGNVDRPQITFPAVDGPELGVTVLPQPSLEVPEGGSAGYTVVLDTQPTDDVMITVTWVTGSGSDTDLTASPVTLTFTNSNWNTPQTVTVSAAEDADGTHGIRNLLHDADSADSLYHAISIAAVRAVEADNDEIGVTVWPQVLRMPDGGSREYTVVLNTQPTDYVTITVTRDQGGDDDLTVLPDTLIFTKETWDTPQTVTVSAAADDDQVNGVAVFSHSVESNDENYQSDDEITIASVTVTEDETRPRVEIQTEASAPVDGAFEVTIRFSENVRGFTLRDIGVSNGTASKFNNVSSRRYTVTITPEESGEVRVEVRSNVARDGAGNGNRAAEPLVIEADLERPEVTIAGPTEPVGMAGLEVTITFSEPVEGFELEDIRVTNGTASNFTKVSPQEYTAEITPSASGAVKMEVAEDVARDGGGNGNQAAEPLVIKTDLERPEVTIEGPTEPVGLAGFEVTITFSEPVTGFELEDIQVTNGTASNFTKVSPPEYTATITPEGIAEVRVEVPEDVAEDGAGNGNQAAEAFEVETKLAVSYQEESYTATEGGEAVTVTVKLSQGWDEELAIPIRVTRPEETEVAGYTLDGLEDWDAQEGTGTLTFPAEETEQTFTIEANHDGDGDDETVELGFGELPEIVMAGEPAVATVTLEDKGLVELKVSFGQAEYQVMEGQQADIEIKVAPTADRRVEVPLVVTPKGGATDEDYSGVPAKVVFEEGESEGTISVEVLADEVNDPGEGIVLSFGELPEAVSAGDPSSTQVQFRQRRTAEQFSQTLEAMLAVIARTMGQSAQTAIEGRFERHRQWSRLGPSVGAVPTAQPGSDNSTTGLGQGESQRIGSESLEGAGRRRAEGPVVSSAGGAAGAPAAMGSSGESGDRESGVQGSWLQNVSLSGLAGMFGYGQGYAGVSTGSGIGPSGTGPTVGLGGQPGYGQNRFQGTGTRNSSLRSGSGEYSGRRNRELNLAGVSFELPLAGQQKGTSRSWVPALWGQGDLQHFNGNLTRYEMSYRGGLEAAHVGLDLYANDKVLAGLSFMRSWGNMDYSDDGIDGALGSRMNTFHPYLYWQPTERVSVWGMGGLGRGRVDVNEPGRSHNFEADFRMFSGGVRTVLSRRGSNEVGLRADAFTAQLGTEASEDIAKVRGEAHRARLMLEWVHTKQLSAGRSVSLKAEAGGRFDGGDAERGSGAETGFRLGYLDANSGLDVAMLGRVLVVHESDYRDWGVGVQASWDPGEKQRGFRASVTSTRGQDGGGRTTLWNNANTVTRPPGMDAMGMSSQSRMESEVAYGGLKALGLPGLLTPYSRLRWAGQGRELAWGTAWSLPPRSQLALPLMLELEALRRENRTGPADLAVLVRMSIPF